MRAWRQHDRRSLHLLVGDLPEEMLDAVEPDFFLSTASTIHARVYASQRRLDSRSMGLNFRCLRRWSNGGWLEDAIPDRHQPGRCHL